MRDYPYVRCIDGCRTRAPTRRYRHSVKWMPAPIENLRRGGITRSVIQTKKIVHEKLAVIVYRRVAVDPPPVTVRRHYAEDA